MVVSTDVEAFHAKAITSSRTTFAPGVRSTISSILSPATTSKSSSQTTSRSTSSPTPTNTSNLLNVSMKNTRWIIVGVVAGVTIVILCVLLLFCWRKVSRKRQNSSQPVVLIVERGPNLANTEQRAQQSANMLSNIPPQSAWSMRPLESPHNPVVEARRDGIFELDRMSDNRPVDTMAESHSNYWKTYKKRELQRRGSSETEMIRKGIERARSRDHTEWEAHRKSLSEDHRSTPIDGLVSPEGSKTPNKAKSLLNMPDSQEQSTRRLLDTVAVRGISHGPFNTAAGTNREEVMGTSHGAVNADAGTSEEETTAADYLDAPPVYSERAKE